MPDIDLNQKVLGVKAKIHFIIFAAVQEFALVFCLLSLIDYSNLPSKVDKDVSEKLTMYLMPIASMTFFVTIGLLLLYCLPNKIFYGIVGVILGLCGVLGSFIWFIGFFTDFGLDSMLPGYAKDKKMRKKYWKNAEIGRQIQGFLSVLTNVYLAVVLCKLAFSTTPPPPSVPTAAQGPKIIIVQEDEEEKSGNSGNSGQLDKTRKSGKSGKSEKSGKSGLSVEEE